MVSAGRAATASARLTLRPAWVNPRGVVSPAAKMPRSELRVPSYRDQLNPLVYRRHRSSQALYQCVRGRPQALRTSAPPLPPMPTSGRHPHRSLFLFRDDFGLDAAESHATAKNPTQSDRPRLFAFCIWDRRTTPSRTPTP